MNTQGLNRFCIGRRVAAKAKAPRWTEARNLQQKTRAALLKKYGPGNVFAVDAKGNDCDALELLQLGQSVTFRHYHMSKPGDGTLFNSDEYALSGERTVQIKS